MPPRQSKIQFIVVEKTADASSRKVRAARAHTVNPNWQRVWAKRKARQNRSQVDHPDPTENAAIAKRLLDDQNASATAIFPRTVSPVFGALATTGFDGEPATAIAPEVHTCTKPGSLQMTILY
jgi:hypothetical protein